jgi:uncharacterized protein
MLQVKTKIGNSKLVPKGSAYPHGLIADQDIKKGEVIWSFTKGLDREVAERTIDALSPEMKAFIENTASYEDGYYMIHADNARFINHSDTPNTEYPEDYVMVASEDIAKGEEITTNYNSFLDEGDQKFEGKDYPAVQKATPAPANPAKPTPAPAPSKPKVEKKEDVKEKDEEEVDVDEQEEAVKEK